MADTVPSVGSVPNVPSVPSVPTVGGPQAPPKPNAPQQAARQPQPLKKQSPGRVQSGSLVFFEYLFYKHDPYPLVLCSGVWSDQRVAGVNLHYLTFRYIRSLVHSYCGKQFSYQLIKGNRFVTNAFRSYKRQGIRNHRILDCDFLMRVLGSVRSFKPSEVEAIRQEIQRQIRGRQNPSAEQLADQFGARHDTGKPTYDDGRRNPNLG